MRPRWDAGKRPWDCASRVSSLLSWRCRLAVPIQGIVGAVSQWRIIAARALLQPPECRLQISDTQSVCCAAK